MQTRAWIAAIILLPACGGGLSPANPAAQPGITPTAPVVATATTVFRPLPTLGVTPTVVRVPTYARRLGGATTGPGTASGASAVSATSNPAIPTTAPLPRSTASAVAAPTTFPPANVPAAALPTGAAGAISAGRFSTNATGQQTWNGVLVPQLTGREWVQMDQTEKTALVTTILQAAPYCTETVPQGSTALDTIYADPSKQSAGIIATLANWLVLDGCRPPR